MARQNSARKDKTYRLSLVDNDTHNTIRTVRFTKLRFIYAAITVVLVLIVVFYSIIAFTPLRTSIPGYPDANSKKVAVANAIKIDSLENIITRWNLYATDLSSVLTGEVSVNFDSIIRNSKFNYLSDKDEAELARKDSILRGIVQKEEKFGLSGTSGTSVQVEGMHFFTPLHGVLSGKFERATHPYVEITAPAGTIVSAVYDGHVIYAGWDDEQGYLIIIQHKDDFVSIYGNNQELLKSSGDAVKAGTPIALVGNMVNEVETNNLHFELWHSGEAIDPGNYISF